MSDPKQPLHDRWRASAALRSAEESAGGWIVAQQFVLRGLAAAKFYLVAVAFGPEAFGLLTVALIALALAEALSDTGVPAALVQSPGEVRPPVLKAAFGALVVRGVVLSVLLYLGSGLVARAFNVADASQLVQWVALVPLLRAFVSPGIHLAYRERRFRSLFLVDAPCAMIDLAVLVALLYTRTGVEASIFATLAGEASKVGISWWRCAIPLTGSATRADLVPLVPYARWIWAGNVSNVLLNNLDKWLVARFLGPVELAAYHLAQRTAQLLVAEPATMSYAYLFPTFALLSRDHSLGHAKAALRRWTVRFAIICGASAILTAAVSLNVLVQILGERWQAAAVLCAWMTVPMWLAAMLTIRMQFAKAVGTPRSVVVTNLVQGAVLASFGSVLASSHGAFGMVAAVIASTAVALVAVSIEIGRYSRRCEPSGELDRSQCEYRLGRRPRVR